MQSFAYVLLFIAPTIRISALENNICNPPITLLNSTQTKNNNNNERSLCHNKPHPKMTICPEGFIFADPNLCIWVRDNQPYPPSCPYPHFLPYFIAEIYIDELFQDKSIWINAYRNTSNGFPLFHWTENGEYGQNFTREIVNLHNQYGKNCIIVNNKFFYRVFCSEKHSVICIYHRDFFASYMASKCDKEGYLTCMVANYDLRNQKCFCQKYGNLGTKKKSFCNKLIEPLPYQSKLLANQFKHTTHKCWIGLYKQKTSEGVYRWLSTNTVVEYTHWIDCNSCEHYEGAYQYSPEYTQNGWLLQPDETLNCALCEISVKYESPSLRLRHLESKNKIELVISKPNTISVLGFRPTDHLDIYCFSDRLVEYFKEYIKISINMRDFNKSVSLLTYDIPLLEDQPGHYWCEAFQYPSSQPITSNVLVGITKTERYGHEFSLEVKFQVDSVFDPLYDQKYLKICNYIKELITAKWNHVLHVRPMRGYLREEYSMDMIVHITTKNTKQTASEQHLKLTEALQNWRRDVSKSEILNSEVCLFNTSLTNDRVLLEWPETRIGTIRVPSNILCLDRQNNMQPVTRNCTGDFLFGGKWSDPTGDCFSKEHHSEITMKLFNLLKSNTSAENISTILMAITENVTNMDVIDVHLIASLLEKLEEFNQTKAIIRNYAGIVSNIMKFKKTVLKDAQLLLNSTDKILSSFDSILDKMNSTISITSSRLLVKIININPKDVIGFALFRNRIGYKISCLFKNTSFTNLIYDPFLEAAIILPPVEKENVTINETPTKLILTVFLNDALFNSVLNDKTTNTILSVSGSNFKGSLKSPLKLLFKVMTFSTISKYCVYWNYGIDELWVGKYGLWERSGLSKSDVNFIELCEFFHMTHFGLLLNDKINEYANDHILHVFRTVGSALSLIGISPIFVTAILFKQWRNREGNIILLNLCMSIALQSILMFCSYAINGNGVACKTNAILLHYSMLAEFCWMLVIAILEYKRFVIVFEKSRSERLLWHFLIGWGVPILPITISLLVSPDGYEIIADKVCYVSGNSFIFGLLLPVVLILTNNFIIFVSIFYSILQANFENVRREYNYKLEIFLAILLFFMLGMSELFGVVGILGGGIVFMYLFCITVIIRSFVLFSFFIVGNKETRNMWKKRVKNCTEATK